jgi:hypothetical protein
MKIPPPTFRLVARLDACVHHPELDLTGDESPRPGAVVISIAKFSH